MNGFVYILSNSRLVNLYKVGCSADPERRVLELHTTGVPAPFSIEMSYPVSDMESAENAAHSALRPYRVASNREFFDLPLDLVIKKVESAISSWDQREEIRVRREREEEELRVRRKREEEEFRIRRLREEAEARVRQQERDERIKQDWKRRMASAAKELSKAIEAALRFARKHELYVSRCEESQDLKGDTRPAHILVALWTSKFRGYTIPETHLLRINTEPPERTTRSIQVWHADPYRPELTIDGHDTSFQTAAEFEDLLTKMEPQIVELKRPWWRRRKK